MHVYKIKTQSKENCTEQHYKFQSIKSTDSTADCCHCGEKRWDHPLLQGFRFCCWRFCAMEQGWRGETLKVRSFWHVGIVLRSTEKNQPISFAHVPLLPRRPPGPSQCVLRSFASRLGYRAWVSWLMDTKQRCPWWWREFGKLESIPAFNTHTPSPLPSYNSFSQSLPVWLSLCLSVCLCSQSA